MKREGPRTPPEPPLPIEKEVAMIFMTARARSRYQGPIPKSASFTDSMCVPRTSGKTMAIRPTMKPPMAGFTRGWAFSVS